VSTLVVAEHREGRVLPITYELIAAAAGLGDPVMVAVVGAGAAELADAIDVAGVDEVLCVDTPAREFENDVAQHALERLYEQRRPHAVLVGFTVDSLGYAPAAAFGLGLGFASDVWGIAVEEGELVATRSLYGGKVHATVDFPGCDGVLLMLRPGAWKPADVPSLQPTGGTRRPSVEHIALEPPSSRARARTFRPREAPDRVLSDAEVVVAVGRGVGDERSLPAFEELAERLGGALAVSRPLVDAGWAPAARQVGQSGTTVAPRVYLAFGISGAIQHVAGMRGSGTIVAVNSDPAAGIFDVAHYYAVADMFDVADELDRLLS
jgi:electron transfer flavoprotein alpha subunit